MVWYGDGVSVSAALATVTIVPNSVVPSSDGNADTRLKSKRQVPAATMKLAMAMVLVSTQKGKPQYVERAGKLSLTPRLLLFLCLPTPACTCGALCLRCDVRTGSIIYGFAKKLKRWLMAVNDTPAEFAR